MTRNSAPPPSPRDFDDLWQLAHWNERLGAKPLDHLLIGVLLAAFVWNPVANLWLPSAAWVPANCALAALLVAAARTNGLSWEELGMRPDRYARGLAVGAVATAAILTVIAITVAWPATRDFFEDPQIAADTVGARLFNPLVRIPLGTVVLEETLFRGVLLGLALRRWSVATAVLVTSAFFGLWHIVPAAESADNDLGPILATIAVTTVGGVLLAWLRLRANSILAPVLAHVATNSFSYLAAIVALQFQ
jgi:uncharacterized protein